MARLVALSDLVEAALELATRTLLAPDDVVLYHVELVYALAACPDHGGVQSQPTALVTLALEAPEQAAAEPGARAWSSGQVALPQARLMDAESCREAIEHAVQEMVFARQAAGASDLATQDPDAVDGG